MSSAIDALTTAASKLDDVLGSARAAATALDHSVAAALDRIGRGE